MVSGCLNTITHKVVCSHIFGGKLRTFQGTCRPDDDDNAVEDIVGVPQVLKEAKSSQLQDHLQGEHAGEDDIADLQDVGQLIGLVGGG